MTLTRRQAINQFWMLLASSPLLRGQDSEVAQRPVHQPDRIPPVEDLVNSFEYEDVARKLLSRPLYDHIAAGAGSERTLRRNREFFDRITFRPRMLVDVSSLVKSSPLTSTSSSTALPSARECSSMSAGWT